MRDAVAASFKTNIWLLFHIALPAAWATKCRPNPGRYMEL
jgi:hypothetical protein